MKILSIGLDKSILDKSSSLAKRVFEYGEMVKKYTVVVPSDKVKENNLSDKVSVYGSGGGNKLMQIFRLWQLANKLFKEDRYDVVSVQDQYFIGLLAFLVKLKFKIGLEMQIHGFEKYFGIRKIIADFIIPRADAIRVVSKRLQKQLVSDFGVDKGRVTVVPIFTGTRKHERTKTRSMRYGGDKVIFIYTGRFVGVKNLEMMIDAMASDELRTMDCELWLVGDGELRENYELRITNYELDNKIKIFSWQDNLDEIYRKADCFLLSSDYEGWGLSVIEAASYGLSVIMTDVGCAGEVIVNNESGIVIPVGDQEALEMAMLKLAENVDLRKSLGENARKAVEKLPSKKETLGLYRESWKKAARKSTN